MRTQATYRIFGDESKLTAGRVTQALGFEATKCWEVGGTRGGGAPPAKIAGWMLESSETPEDDIELPEQLERVLVRLLPRRDALWGLVESGYRIDWFCYVGSHAAEHAVELPRRLLEDLLRVPGELLLDIYHDHPEDD
jgi:hypothetical protein